MLVDTRTPSQGEPAHRDVVEWGALVFGELALRCQEAIRRGRGKCAVAFGGFDGGKAGRVEGVVGRRPAVDLDRRLPDDAIVE